ncbi:MAG: hypothetical protein HFG16_00175 [Erysipelotrichaceae bacterium]|jgi:sortase B|nr:hypothetical protein [Erysipelotrichaceae bacterium]
MQIKNRRGNRLRSIGYILSLFCFLSCIGQLSFFYMQVYREKSDIRQLRHTANIQQGQLQWEDLQRQNADIIGWLTIPGTNIDYPIVQGNDNRYYLTHNFLKEAHYARRYFS